MAARWEWSGSTRIRGTGPACRPCRPACAAVFGTWCSETRSAWKVSPQESPRPRVASAWRSFRRPPAGGRRRITNAQGNEHAPERTWPARRRAIPAGRAAIFPRPPSESAGSPATLSRSSLFLPQTTSMLSSAEILGPPAALPRGSNITNTAASSWRWPTPSRPGWRKSGI